ncbi:MAG: YcjF family protein [Rhizobiaceae bacterium]
MTQRKPAAFRIDPEMAPAKTVEQPEEKRRAPRAVAAAHAVVVPAEIDVFAEPDAETSLPPPATAPRGRSRLAAIFLGALGIIVSLGVGLLVDQLIRDLFARADWLGWLALGVAGIGALALLVIIVREIVALSRLASVERLRRRAAEAYLRDDAKAARGVVTDLTRLVALNPDTAAGRRALAEMEHDIIDGSDLIRIAEAEVLAPLDARAKTLVLDAAKRVSLVTAVSPRALVDIAYVAFEAARLIRRLSALYGGRPGTLGFFRIARSVLAHLAVTGSIAAGDSFVQQIVGHGLAARLSAKLGEGLISGMMTARIGLAAMEATRPLPFNAVKKPGLSDFMSALTSFAGRSKTGPQNTPE